MTTCTIPGCVKPIEAKGWCKMHYTRWRRNGDPLQRNTPKPAWITELAPEQTIRRFNAKFSIDKATGCWLWTGAIGGDGYGHFTRPPRMFVQAHRFSYLLLVGPIPDDMVLDHLCRVRHCVNPRHLEVVTFTENVRRGVLARQDGAS